MIEMTRRAALKAAVVGMASVAIVGLPRRTYGYVTVENCHRVTGFDSSSARVLLDGVTVTAGQDTPGRHRVIAADDRCGFIDVFDDHNGTGFQFGKDGRLKRRRLYGHVDIVHKDDCCG